MLSLRAALTIFDTQINNGQNLVRPMLVVVMAHNQ